MTVYGRDAFTGVVVNSWAIRDLWLLESGHKLFWCRICTKIDGGLDSGTITFAENPMVNSPIYELFFWKGNEK